MTYPEMNNEIVEILRSYSDPSMKYAADRIEELERQLDQAVKACIFARDAMVVKTEDEHYAYLELEDVIASIARVAPPDGADATLEKE